ncbi:MAG TPA: methyl-accepting chemotaxis protein, partial [Rhodocyclaceae bacterium]|nr:methyl-accepting chemotaxis protein [Rhodocyclaceae bacterium]
MAILLLLVFGGVAYQAIKQQSAALQEIKETRFEQFRTSAEMAQRLSKVHVQLFGLVTWFSAYDKATQDRLIAEIPKTQAKLMADFQALQADAGNKSEEKQKMAEISGLLEKYRKEMDAAINMVQIDVTSALGDMRAVAGHFAALEKAFDELSALERQLADKTYAEAQAGARVALSINLVVLLLAIGIAGTIGFLTARRLLAQLGGEPALAVEVAGRIAGGDLTVAVPPAQPGSLIAAMGTMRDGLRQTMTRMSENAVALSAAAEQVASAAGQVAQRSSEQNDAAATMAAAIEEMSVSIGNVAASAKGASETSSHSGATAHEGAAIVLGAAQEMENIAGSVGEVSA